MVLVMVLCCLCTIAQNLQKFEQNGKYGLKDAVGTIVVPAKYDELQYPVPNYHQKYPPLHRVMLNGKYGFIDNYGKEIIPCKYDYTRGYGYKNTKWLAGVCLNGKYGYIDTFDNVVIPFQYERGMDFVHDMAAVVMNNKVGFINVYGNLVVPCQYDVLNIHDSLGINVCHTFLEGIVAVKKNGKYGFINKEGAILTDFKYDDMKMYSSGGKYEMIYMGKTVYIDECGNEYNSYNECFNVSHNCNTNILSNQLPTITFQSPSSSTSTSYRLKACIKSNSQISSAKVTVNGSVVINNSRGIDPVVNNDCAYFIDQNLTLRSGSNTIVVSVTNAKGTENKTLNVTVSGTHPTPPQPMQTDKRIALVVGIKNYRYTSPLKNTINDANAIESKLKQCGFEVIKKTDLRTAADVQNAINDFGARARNGYDVALFFYSGHGINYNNESWIAPTDAQISCLQDIPKQCANAGWIMDATSGVKNRIVIFDACRNLPNLRDCENPHRDIEGHINGITEFKKGGGAFIAYATSFGEVSGDGPDGGNGIYTGELLKVLDIPNLNILDVFSETATRVHNKTKGNQNPTNTSAFYSRFIFNKK